MTTTTRDRRKIRVGLFGCGWVQDFHARAVREHPRGQLVAVANHRRETARRFATRHGIGRVTTDWEALAVDPEIDAAIVATPNALHAAQAIRVLRADRHVLVEKPMATTFAECDAMLDAARRSAVRSWSRTAGASITTSSRCGTVSPRAS